MRVDVVHKWLDRYAGSKKVLADSLFRYLIIFVLCDALLSGASAYAKSLQVPIPPAIVGQDYRLVKNWDFTTNVKSYGQLRSEFYTRYIYDNGTLDHLGDEWERYRENLNHVVDAHALHLVARLHSVLAKGNIESGMIRSKWTGKYGYFEASIKVPKGRGFWPAFWINPEDQVWPPEIDIMEIVNNGTDSTHCSFHFIHGTNLKELSPIFSLLNARGSYCPGSDYADAFHNFALLWTPTTVSHYVDGKLVAARRFTWLHNDGSGGGNAHIIINLGVGGKWPGPPLESTEFPSDLAIAYIRVWQR